MYKLKTLTVYQIMLWSCIAFMLIFSAIGGFVFFNPNIDSVVRINVVIVCSVGLTIVTFGSAFSFVAFKTQKRFITQLKKENRYTLGIETVFYNLDAFKNKVRKMRRHFGYQKKLQYMVVFTPTAIDISINAFGNKEMVELNQKIVSFLDNLFENEKSIFVRRNNIYAFNRGAFLLFTFVDKEQNVHELINKIQSELFRLINEEKMKIWIQPFYGIKRVDPHSDDVVGAIEDALIARSASEANYESYTYYSESLRKEVSTGLDDIAKALKNDEFVPYYQPKYSIKEKRFVSAEALARWKSPIYGILGPSKFIEKAEQAGLLSAIDIDIFEHVLKDLSDNIRRGRRVVPVSCNFSLYEFFSTNFLDTVVGMLKKYQVPAKYIEIEVTETTSQVNKFLSVSVIKKIKELGARVLMDDYGVGYSQIQSLNEIPFDGIKIDKSFADDIVDNEKARAIVKFLIELGHNNGMEVTIEGIETKEQVEILKRFKIDTIQGFYYSRPLSFANFNEFLKTNEFEKEAK